MNGVAIRDGFAGNGMGWVRDKSYRSLIEFILKFVDHRIFLSSIRFSIFHFQFNKKNLAILSI